MVVIINMWHNTDAKLGTQYLTYDTNNKYTYPNGYVNRGVTAGYRRFSDIPEPKIFTDQFRSKFPKDKHLLESNSRICKLQSILLDKIINGRGKKDGYKPTIGDEDQPIRDELELLRQRIGLTRVPEHEYKV